jgi:uncharacterized protein (DUF1697 family)
VFSTRAASAERIAARIRKEVAAQLGVDALVIVKSAGQLSAIVQGNALGDATDHSRLLVAMAQDAAAIAALQPLARLTWGKERLHVGEHAAYLWCANGILESRAVDAVLGRLPAGTTRNWATLNKIHALMNG